MCLAHYYGITELLSSQIYGKLRHGNARKGKARQGDMSIFIAENPASSKFGFRKRKKEKKENKKPQRVTG